MAVIKTIKLFSEVLEEVFGEPPETKDIYDEVTRPCTYISPTSIIATPNGSYIEEEISLKITRFAECNYKGYLELLHYVETLEVLLTAPVMVKHFATYPENVHFELFRDDFVMECNFNVTVVCDATDTAEAETAAELMRILKAKLKINNEESELIVE